MKLLIHIAAVEHQSGIDLYSAATEEVLDTKLAAYCRSHWGTCDHNHIENGDHLPDEKCIELYFDGHENDSLSRGCASVELDLHVVVAIYAGRPRVSIHSGDSSAMAAALDAAMENRSDPTEDPIAVRSELELRLTDHDHIDEPGSDFEVHLLTPANSEL